MRKGLRNWIVAVAIPTTAVAQGWDGWDDWYDGDVEIRVAPTRGEGALYASGDKVKLEFRANADAYHLVYAIDTDGYVRVLFPRFWEDDGWVPAGRQVKLQSRDLAWPSDRWGSDGIVYVEAVASPTPFDWRSLGLAYGGAGCSWIVDGVPLRVHGDPFLAMNDIHRRLFPVWQEAVFCVDYTYFYVGRHCDAPRYLGYPYERVYLPPFGVSVSVRFSWGWEFGRYCARPVYRRYYAPGRHVVHHVVHYVDRQEQPRRHHYVLDERRDRDPRVERKRNVQRERKRSVEERATDRRHQPRRVESGRPLSQERLREKIEPRDDGRREVEKRRVVRRDVTPRQVVGGDAARRVVERRETQRRVLERNQGESREVAPREVKVRGRDSSTPAPRGAPVQEKPRSERQRNKKRD